MDRDTLQLYRLNNREIAQLQDERIQLQKKVKRYGKSDELKAIDAVLAKKIADLFAINKRIETVIYNLPSNQRGLMWWHYVEGLSWEEIAWQTGHSTNWTYKLHKKILKRIKHW